MPIQNAIEVTLGMANRLIHINKENQKKVWKENNIKNGSDDKFLKIILKMKAMNKD
jgi:hypothetical protein